MGKLREKYIGKILRLNYSDAPYIDDEYHYDKWLEEQAKVSTKVKNFFSLMKIVSTKIGNKFLSKLNLKNVTDPTSTRTG